MPLTVCNRGNIKSVIYTYIYIYIYVYDKVCPAVTEWGKYEIDPDPGPVFDSRRCNQQGLKSLQLSPPTQRRRKHESLNAKP